MASRGGHLDATGGREVVYCHRCENEWYKDERPASLICPACNSDITEIVSVDNDPRSMNDESIFGFERNQPHRRVRFPDSDSDPDEADIDEHTHQGPGGFFGRRTVFRSPEGPAGWGRRDRANPSNSEDIIRRFAEMLGDMSGPMMVGRSGPETLFNDGEGPHRVTYRRFTSGPGFTGGVRSFTITTGSGPSPALGRTHQAGGPGESEPEDPFQRVFAEILSGVGPPPLHREEPQTQSPNRGNGGNAGNAGNAGNGGGIGGGIGGGRPTDLATALNQLFASVLAPGGIHGDAVYSQEALDRIITNLMEANPQSNAPAPASEDAIATLPKKKLDEEMLGPELKGECTICIDDMKIGDEVVVLPCKHWFHEECVVLWLKEHNSCPVCRAPIDGNAAGQSRPIIHPDPDPSYLQHPRYTPAESSSFSRPGASERRRSNLRQRGEARLDSIRDLATPYERHQTPRRDSNSPPMHHASAQYSPRVRSTSPSSRRSSQSERARDSRGSGNTGPLHWLRDQFTRDRRA